MKEENTSEFTERREFERHSVQYPAELFYKGRSLGAAVIDISENGAGIILPEDIPLGEELVLKMKCPCEEDSEKIIELTTKIIWVDKDDPEDIFRAGLQISHVSREDFNVLKNNLQNLSGMSSLLKELELKEKTILIIEDDQSLRFIMDFDLCKRGFKTIMAEKGEVGLEKAKKDQPDLILLDVMMPGIDGYETCRRLKKDESTRNIPVLMLSVKSQRKDILEALQAGAEAYVVKSHGFDILFRKIAELIGEA